MARKLMLSYDASVDWHYNSDKDFRQKLVEFLILNGANQLESYVSSTIYFETLDYIKKLPADKRGLSLSEWKTEIITEFGKHFHFSLAVIQENKGGGEDMPYKNIDAPSKTIKNNFKALVERIKNPPQ
jgi:hypothetical protein